MRGIYLQLKQCYSVREYFTLKKSLTVPFSSSLFNFFFDFGFKFHSFYPI
jgi:hypothetical protein